MVRERLQRLKAGAIEEIRKLFWISLYFWVLLSLFSFHKALVLKEQYLLYDQLFALVNAVVLAKVILIGEFVHIGEKLENRPLIYPVLFQAAIFAVLLIVFHIAEESLRGAFMDGKTFSESLSAIDSGRIQGIFLVGIIMFVVLIPFFAFKELERAIGAKELHNLLFGDETKARSLLPISALTGRRLAAAGALAVSLGGGWLIWHLYRDREAAYTMPKREGGPAARDDAASGADATAAAVPVGTRVSGVVQALQCDVNMKVKAGQLCAKLDARPYQSAVDKNKSDLAQAEARLEKDKADLAKAKAAFGQREAQAKHRSISRKEIEKLRKTYEQAQGAAKRGEAIAAELQAALHAAETNLSYTDIVAPVAGTVVSRYAEIGQTVAAGSQAPPLFLIATDPSPALKR